MKRENEVICHIVIPQRLTALLCFLKVIRDVIGHVRMSLYEE